MRFRSVLLIICCLISFSLAAQILDHEGKSPFVEVIKNVRESVVNIQAEGQRPSPQNNRFPFDDDILRYFFGPRDFNRQRTSMGSGFIFKREGNNVYILTNNHVLEAGQEGTITVTLADKEKITAEIIGLDPDTDLGIIKITVESNTQVVVADLGDSDDLEIGEWVIAIGNPFGQLSLHRTVTVGVVSAVGRNNLDFGEGASPIFQDYIQTDAAINPGNSGGPLLDIHGKVIGINSAITTTSGGSIGIGFAIPINIAKKVANDFLNHGQVLRAFLGVTLQEISQEIASSFGLKDITGVLVTRVEKDTPADKAGIKNGDVIVEFNNQKIEDVSKFRLIVANSPVNQKIPIKLIRDKKEKIILVTLTNRESSTKIGEEKIEENKEITLGLSIDSLDSDFAKRNNITGEEGMVITRVGNGSQSFQAGLRVGDILVELNGTRIRNIDDYQKVLEKAQKDKDSSVMAYVQSRDGTYKYVPIKLS